MKIRRIGSAALLVLLLGMAVASIGPAARATEAKSCLLPVLQTAPGTLTYCVDVRTSFDFEGCDAVTCRVVGRAELQASGPAGGSGRVILHWGGSEASQFCTWTAALGAASCYAIAVGTLEWPKAFGCQTWNIVAEGHVTPLVPLQLPIAGVMNVESYDGVRTCPNGQIT